MRALLLLCLLIPSLAFGQYIAPKDFSGRAGDVVTMEVDFDTGPDPITLAQFAFRYDTNTLEFESATCEIPGMYFQNIVTDPVWPETDLVLQMYGGPSYGYVGSGLATTITFRVLAAPATHTFKLDDDCAHTAFVLKSPVISICPTLYDATFRAMTTRGVRGPTTSRMRALGISTWSSIKVAY